MSQTGLRVGQYLEELEYLSMRWLEWVLLPVAVFASKLSVPKAYSSSSDLESIRRRRVDSSTSSWAIFAAWNQTRPKLGLGL